tara:strand:+ start:1330 stop:2811 length:1482 start_codon:yes stop_codon:yes gene_type:complete
MLKFGKFGLLSAPIGLGSYYLYKNRSVQSAKEYTYDEIQKHNKESDIWVTYKNNVYDITKFIDNHPGGKSKVMLAAGSAIDPYWNIYKQHTNNPLIVKDILDPLKIGIIKDYDENKYSNFKDVYVNDPIRDSELKFHSLKPCNAETPIEHIMDNWITPNNYWYIRNHCPVPDIDINNYNLSITSSIDKFDKMFSFKELKSMPTKKVITTIQCGGNRRKGHNEIEKTSGTPWNIGAISTAEWEGISLKDFLVNNKIDSAKIKENNIKHIHFESIDGVKASIPISKVFDTEYGGDVILAHKMNGEDLPRDHGYPLRVIVPGYVGIRNVKWLKKMTLSETEIDSIWQTGLSYKGVPHYIKDVKEISLHKIPPIYEMPVQSCIADISLDNKKKKLKVKGFAWAGGGRNIIRVDVSVNNGARWKMAELKEGSNQELNRAWAWTFWEAEFDVFPDDYFDIVCKATDQSYNVQPETCKHIWNIRGLNNNSWHYMLLWNKL